MLATAEMTFQGHPRSSQTTWYDRPRGTYDHFLLVIHCNYICPSQLSMSSFCELGPT